MQQLNGLAERYRVTSATVIRWSLRGLVEYVRMNDGRIALPVDFCQLPDAGRHRSARATACWNETRSKKHRPPGQADDDRLELTKVREHIK
jgi:hypothetical protein